MKLILLALVASSCAFSQHASGSHGGPGGNRGGAHFNRGSGHFLAPPPVAHHAHGSTVIVPYPVFYGGYYYCDPAYCNPAAGNGDAGAAPAPANNYAEDSGAAPPTPVVIVNQSFQSPTANGVLHDYSNVPLPPPTPNPDAKPDDQPTIYLIAMTDHTILPAIAYWVDGDTLDYITQDGDQNRLSLALVDRDFSRKLNADRGVEFRLPAK